MLGVAAGAMAAGAAGAVVAVAVAVAAAAGRVATAASAAKVRAQALAKADRIKVGRCIMPIVNQSRCASCRRWRRKCKELWPPWVWALTKPG